MPRSRALVVLIACLASALRGQEPANVLLIVADDLGYGEPGCYGGSEIPTPHLDALAARGTRFTQGYVTASFCAPSRAGLLTGRYQTSFGFEGNPTGALNEDPRVGLPREQRTLADWLREEGYATALAGKWHLGGTAPHHPLRRGFDEFFGFLHEGHYFVPPPWQGVTTWLRRPALPGGAEGRWTSPDGRVIWSTHMPFREPDYDANNPILRGSQPVEEPSYLTDAFTREGVDFIRRSQGQPWFLYLAYSAVHSPLQALDADMERHSGIEDIHRRVFAAMLTNLDDNLGRLWEALRETGAEDNTLVFFLSDNGGATRELTSRNASLRGEKGSLLEGGIRVPFLVSWPAAFAGGRAEDSPVISLDILPTAMAAAGAELDPDRSHGVNLLPLLRGEASAEPGEERAFFWRMGGRHAARRGDWKVVRQARRDQPDAWELYHLAEDIGESRDLATDQPERAAALSALWEEWNSEQEDAKW